MVLLSAIAKSLLKQLRYTITQCFCKLYLPKAKLSEKTSQMGILSNVMLFQSHEENCFPKKYSPNIYLLLNLCLEQQLQSLRACCTSAIMVTQKFKPQKYCQKALEAHRES